jgi:hypothetical protein
MNIQTALVMSILERSESFDWTVQGFGMLRTKIKDAGRIHVWDSRLRNALVSDVHAHPWPLTSTIISGELINVRYREVDTNSPQDVALALRHKAMWFRRSLIKTGEGGGLTGESTRVLLRPEPPEIYTAGETYAQQPEEVHRTIPRDGTVTLMERPMGEPLQETVVYWPDGAEWVTAEPCPAMDRQRKMALGLALMLWAPA